MKIDYVGLARGLIDTFSEEEKTILRFGMLPAKKMEVFEKCLKEKVGNGWEKINFEVVCEIYRQGNLIV